MTRLWAVTRCGADTLLGGDGNDTLFGGEGSVSLMAVPALTRCFGGSGE